MCPTPELAESLGPGHFWDCACMGEDAGLQGKRGRVRMQGCRSCGYGLGCRDAESEGVEEGTGKGAAPLLAQVASPGWPGTDRVPG